MVGVKGSVGLLRGRCNRTADHNSRCQTIVGGALPFCIRFSMTRFLLFRGGEILDVVGSDGVWETDYDGVPVDGEEPGGLWEMGCGGAQIDTHCQHRCILCYALLSVGCSLAAGVGLLRLDDGDSRCDVTPGVWSKCPRRSCFSLCGASNVQRSSSHCVFCEIPLEESYSRCRVACSRSLTFLWEELASGAGVWVAGRPSGSHVS